MKPLHNGTVKKVMVIVALISVFAFGTSALLAQTPEGETPVRTISVTGFGQASAAPDTASIEMGVNITSEDLGEALVEANTTMENVNTALKEIVPEENIQTVSFNVWTEEIYDPMRDESTGQFRYRVQNTVRVVADDIALAQSIIETALESGANQIYNLDFGIADTTELENEARVNAIDDANRRASEIATALGEEVGPVLSISENGSGGVIYGAGGGGRAFDQAAVPNVPIQVGQNSVSVSVSVVYQLGE